MGVQSLQSFLKNNEAYFSDRIILRDTSLVIDGNNLLCQLYCRLALDAKGPHYRNDVHGGDFVQFAKVVKAFFDPLKACKIKPYIVFDGSSAGVKASLEGLVVSKEKESYRRGMDKFRRAQTITETPDTAELIMPQTLVTVFRNLILDMNIDRLQTAYEADTHIARVANEKNCPVLTNDSDFIIYRLNCGFILLDWFEFQTPVRDSTGQLGIQCNLFSQKKLSKSIHGLKPECLPLMSCILGNDYVEAGTFDNAVANICERYYDGFLEASSMNHRRIANLLTWLRQRTLNSAIEDILDMVHPNGREKLNKLLKILLRNYRIEKIDDFEDEMKGVYNRDIKLTDNMELQPSYYLKQLFQNHDIATIALDMIFNNTYYNYAIVDDNRLPSSGYVKYRPYSLALVLLRPQSYLNQTQYQRKVLTEKYSWNIYDRLKDEYAKLLIRPMEKLDKFGSLEHLDCYNMILLEPSLKKDLLMECFHFNIEEFNLLTDIVSKVYDGSYGKEVTICMLLVKYIGIEARMAPKPQFVDALLVTFFFYAACSGGLNKNRAEIPEASVYGKLLLQLRQHSFMNNNIFYEQSDTTLFRLIVHFISQLHSAYNAYHVINPLLGHPFHKTRQDLFMNCTLIYRLTKLFRLAKLKLEELFKDIPTFLDMCGSVKVLVQTCE